MLTAGATNAPRAAGGSVLITGGEGSSTNTGNGGDGGGVT